MFKNIVVIGAGTMGSGIAGQIANAGHQVMLLDLPDDDQPNARTEGAVKRLLKSDPAALMHKRVADNIKVGNTRDDFATLSSADWVIEAVVERLDIKQDLYQRLADVIPDTCIVTSNTSTIPISLLIEKMPASFQQRFAITHYFNPVRYMRLLELVSGDKTDPKIVDMLARFNDQELGKGVVRCGDTPGFLGNRVGVFALQVGIDEAINNNLSIEQADALMGRPMGIPKTGVFGLYDLIGIDLMADVVRSLRSILPEGDEFHAVGQESDMINAMVAQGLTGEKGGGGFYRNVDGARHARILHNGEYREASEVIPASAVAAATALAERREPLLPLVQGNNNEARFARNVLGRVLGYAASLLGEVTDSAQNIDDAMKLGFNWVRGPFEMIDALGSEAVAVFLNDAGYEAPAALQVSEPFYSLAKGRLNVRHADGQAHPVELPEGVVRFAMTRRELTPIKQNYSASLFELDDDLRLLEFHSKANALNDESMQIVLAAAADPGKGILVHNDAQHYSAGVDLNEFLRLIDNNDWNGIDQFLARFQQAVKALKYCQTPVVGAPSGLALGGGYEVLMHCDSLVVHSNSVLGLVESAVGLLPSGGGVKETYLRWYALQGDWSEAAWNTWLNIGYGASGSSPAMAERLAYYRPEVDDAVMNRDRLVTTATAKLIAMSAGYKPPIEPEAMLCGGDILHRMATFMDEGIARGDFFPHDKTVAMHIAAVICSEDGIQQAISEDELYARERREFINLAKTPQTRARIHSMLHEANLIRN
ncbi:MAG: 3-hydroxyacyl-CoA dehydrogenase NAD-binding domain-containing protein [Granulosicoccaceae bacterium]